MKTQFIFPLAAVLLAPATAETIYSGLLDMPIPLNFDGTSLIINGCTLNPFFGGVGVANNDLLQPARNGMGNLDTLLNFSAGDVISGSLNFATGYGGSQDHLGSTFTAGQEGYLGFKLNGTQFGWIRVVFTANEEGAVIKDWAYDSSGLEMVVGRIHQSAAVNNAQTVTLSPAWGESFTLGSPLTDSGGNINSLLKTGAGTTVLSQAYTYSGGTTLTGGTLQLGSGTTGGNGSLLGNIVNNATLLFNNADPQAFSGTHYSGSGSLIKNGAGTLTLSGTTMVAGSLTVGANVNGGTLAVSSGGTLAVGSGAADSLRIASGPGTDAASTGILDLSAANGFTADVGVFAIGSGFNDNSNGTLKLSNNNSITAETAVSIGWDATSNAGTTSGTVTSAGNTSIATPRMDLGAAKNSMGTYTQTTGTLTLAGTTATGTELYLGYQSDDTTSRTAAGTMNLSGGIANLQLSKLVVADNNGTGAHVNGSLTLGSNAANHLEIKGPGTVVSLGLARNTGGTLAGDTATLTLGNLDDGSFIESTDHNTAVRIASRTGSGTVAGTFNFNGGTLKITTNGTAIEGGGGTSALNLSGGAKLVAGADSANWIHNLTTATLGTGGAIIDTNGMTIGVSQAFSGAGTLTKVGAGTLTLSGVSTYKGATNITAGTLVIDGMNTATTGAITVANNARLGGNGATPAAVTIQTGGKLHVGISNWTGTAGTGFTDLRLGNLSFGGTWILDVSSLTNYTNFSEVNKSFSILTVSGSISGFNAANVTVVADSFPGNGTWSVSRSGKTLKMNYTAGTASSNFASWINPYAPELSDMAADNDGDGLSNLQEYAFGLNPAASDADVITYADGVITQRGSRTISITHSAGEAGFHAVFGRRINYLAAGLIYTVQFSSDMKNWVTSHETPDAVAWDDEIEAVTVPFPDTISTDKGPEKPKFYRVGVSMP